MQLQSAHLHFAHLLHFCIFLVFFLYLLHFCIFAYVLHIFWRRVHFFFCFFFRNSLSILFPKIVESQDFKSSYSLLIFFYWWGDTHLYTPFSIRHTLPYTALSAWYTISYKPLSTQYPISYTPLSIWYTIYCMSLLTSRFVQATCQT